MGAGQDHAGMKVYETFLESVLVVKSELLFGPQGFLIGFNQHT